jgi:NADPH2:quinone reductase
VRAALVPAYGGPEVVELAEVPSPPIEPGKVRVRINVGAVNFPDVLVVADTYQVSVPTPFILGSEYAGTVVELGDGAEGVALGDRVFGSTIVGAFAEEFVVAPGSLMRIPDGVDDHTAAAFGVAYRTAYHVLRSVAELHEGEELIVLGAGGGVGSAAVQLGALAGATVTAVASSPEKLDAARALGAARLIDHRAGDLRQALREALPGGADVVVDPVGGDLAEPALRALHFGGRFVTVGYAAGSIPRVPLNLVLLKGSRILGFEFGSWARHRAEELARNDRELLDLLVSGRAAPLIGATFPLAEAGEALRWVADGKAVGKVVVEVGPGQAAQAAD